MKEGVNEVPARGGICGPRMKSRYVMATLGSVGLGIIYGLKVNLHVAIVSMVNHTAITVVHNTTTNATNASVAAISGDTCGEEHGTDGGAPEDGPFAWSTTVQGILLSAYFWGYIVAQLPGGRVAELFSAKWVMLFAVFINVLCTLLTPVMASWHFVALVIMRIGEGIGGGVTFPAMHVMLAHWAPPAERSVMSSIVYAGTALGTVISMLVSGVIAGAISWEAVFYIEGGVCAIWLLLWLWLIADTPQTQKYISEEERQFIANALTAEGGEHKKNETPKIPWKAVLTSGPFWAILIAHTCSNWGWYMVLIELPQYMKNVLNFKISENAVLTAVPFLCMWIFSMILSNLLDRLRAKKKISTTFARKTATLIASLVPLVCFIVLCYIGCQKAVAVTLMTIAVMSIGGMFCGFLSNHIDIAPNFAGTLVALTNTVATIPGIVVPVFVGELTHEDKSINSWRIIFWTTIALYVVEIVVYLIFASGDVQKWNALPDADLGEEQPLKSPTKPKNNESTDNNK